MSATLRFKKLKKKNLITVSLNRSEKIILSWYLHTPRWKNSIISILHLIESALSLSSVSVALYRETNCSIKNIIVYKEEQIENVRISVTVNAIYKDYRQFYIKIENNKTLLEKKTFFKKT